MDKPLAVAYNFKVNKGRRAIRPLSFTQISLYQSCPLCYKLQYIDGLKPKDKWYFSFGLTMHQCAEYFFKVKVPPPPSLDELLQFYEENWLSAGYESPEEETKYKDYGREILSRFWEIHSASFQVPIAVERMFNIDIEGVKLRGFIDRVDKLQNGKLSILDYKTNKELFTVDDLKKDLQLTLYQLAAQRLWQLPVEKLTLYHLRSNTPCSCEPRDEKQLEEASQLVLEVAENIAQERFPATENQYCPCDFPEHCPYYRHQYLKATTEPARQGVLPGIAIVDTVEKYASLKAELKELQKELDELRDVIVSYCESAEVNRVYGTQNDVTYKLMEKTGFNEEEVRELLEPEGLWERVLGLDQPRLNQFLADKDVAEDIRKRLEALRQVVSSYPQLWVKNHKEEEK